MRYTDVLIFYPSIIHGLHVILWWNSECWMFLLVYVWFANVRVDIHMGVFLKGAVTLRLAYHCAFRYVSHCCHCSGFAHCGKLFIVRAPRIYSSAIPKMTILTLLG